jgi:diaminopimelate decarboxylase
VEIPDGKRFYKITGISCDGYDVFRKKCKLPTDIKVGDTLVFEYSGAYTFVYKNFHMRNFPEII